MKMIRNENGWFVSLIKKMMKAISLRIAQNNAQNNAQKLIRDIYEDENFLFLV